MSRDDHNVLGGQLRDFLVLLLHRDADHAHLSELPIHFRIVNDLTEQKHTAIREDLPRCVSKVDRTLNAITETEILSQSDGGVSHRKRATTPTKTFYQ